MVAWKQLTGSGWESASGDNSLAVVGILLGSDRSVVSLETLIDKALKILSDDSPSPDKTGPICHHSPTETFIVLCDVACRKDDENIDQKQKKFIQICDKHITENLPVIFIGPLQKHPPNIKPTSSAWSALTKLGLLFLWISAWYTNSYR